jgi:hypothetical protein
MSQLFESFDGWDSVTVLDARNVTAEEPRAPLDVGLGHIFLFS